MSRSTYLLPDHMRIFVPQYREPPTNINESTVILSSATRGEREYEETREKHGGRAAPRCSVPER